MSTTPSLLSGESRELKWRRSWTLDDGCRGRHRARGGCVGLAGSTAAGRHCGESPSLVSVVETLCHHDFWQSTVEVGSEALCKGVSELIVGYILSLPQRILDMAMRALMS